MQPLLFKPLGIVDELEGVGFDRGKAGDGPRIGKKWLPRVSVTPRSPTMRVLMPIAIDSIAAVDETVWRNRTGAAAGWQV